MKDCLVWLEQSPKVLAGIGQAARRWAEESCNWGKVAAQYTDFLQAVVESRRLDGLAPERRIFDSRTRPPVLDDILNWCSPGTLGRNYVAQHSYRLVRTLELIPRGLGVRKILELGCYMHITPALERPLAYEEVRGAYLGPVGETERKRVRGQDGNVFTCEIDLFDAERDVFPYPDGSFHCVLCCELLEHLHRDPMHMLFEIHRILTNDGVLILTTPNAASLDSVGRILKGFHPGFYLCFPLCDGIEELATRHAREYTPDEVARVFHEAGFGVSRLETGPYKQDETDEEEWARRVLKEHELPVELRGKCIYVVARKEKTPRVRYPSWLYDAQTREATWSLAGSNYRFGE